jgi:hypothetical protein
MEKEFSKNEKVSYRLADILTRLNSGDKLTVKGLHKITKPIRVPF